MSGDDIRAFVALDIAEDVRRAAATLILDGRGAVRGVRWVEPGNLHVTLVFLGNIPARRLDEFIGRITDAVGDVPPFMVSFRGVGAFPSLRRPRVLFADMAEGRPEAVRLTGRIEEALKPAGYRPERREASPHLTLGRIRDPRGPEGTQEWAARHLQLDLGGFPAREVTLFRSDLRPTGPVYTPLAVFRLGREGAGPGGNEGNAT